MGLCFEIVMSVRDSQCVCREVDRRVGIQIQVYKIEFSGRSLRELYHRVQSTYMNTLLTHRQQARFQTYHDH